MVIQIAEEARDTLADGGAVVALESTIIAHGLPFPDNLELARELEAAVRQQGAVPATIAVLAGQLRVGIGDEELERLARDGGTIAKAGMADLAVAMARGDDAATTVSATAAIAGRAGIELFATGGIGGVHRGDTGDISSDLKALADIPIGVISAGAKAILDLPRTLEALETLGVLVIGYQTDELPAFYTRASGLALSHRCDDAGELARILDHRFSDLSQGGVVVANPIPVSDALDLAEINKTIDDAGAAAARLGIAGKALTPFLLARIAESSGGKAVRANCALARANADLAARVAVALCARRAARV